MARLIFDLGFHNGDDTAYYLHKGFKVVALEANPYLWKLGQQRFSKEISEGKLVLLNKAFHANSYNTVDFYINPFRDDLSTCDESKIQYWGVAPVISEVETTEYNDLLCGYGVPYYTKCDIESLDYLLIEQISRHSHKPNYVSFELSRFDYFKIFSYLYVAGYTKFQLTNQSVLGCDGEYKFTEYSSGKFGEYLPKEGWLSFDECLTRYMKYKELKSIDNVNLALGWVDIHAGL